MFDIYMIKNKYNGRVYVGSTNNFKRRISNHFGKLRAKTHSNRRLQKDFERYGGESAFESVLLCSVHSEKRKFEVEDIFMNGFDDKYNILPSAGTQRGRVYTNATLKKMSEAAKGRVMSEAQKEFLRINKTGKRHTEESKRKMSETHKTRYKNGGERGCKISDETAYTIVRLVDLGFDRAFVSEYYGIPLTTVCSIARGAGRKDIYEKYHRDKLNEVKSA